MEEERVKKGAKGRPSTSMSYSGSESESDEMKMVVDSRNEDKSSTAENTAKDDGQEEVEEEEEEEEDEESDEEEEDDEEEEESDDDDDIGVINKKSRKKMTILESESSDDGEGDDCPICLNRLKYQDIGTPEACDHNFCLDCIQLWARNVNTCPVDRREFQLILARHANEDEIFKRIPVSGKSCQNEDDDGDVNQDFTYCELCGRSDREDRLLLCDGCDLGFHCECLDPPLDSVPVEEWFCPDCAEANTQRSGRMLNDLDDMQYLLEENSIDGIPYLRPRRRQIARTRISERVRARIQEYREGLARLVCDDEEPEASDEEGQGPSTRLSRTRSQTRQSEAKRKQSSRKKTKKGTTGKQKSYPKKKLRRRTKTPGKAQIFDRLRNASTSKSPKSRLAGKLGLTKPRMSLRKSDRATAARILKEDLYGAKPLSIMGRKHDLDPFPDDDSHSRLDEPQASTSVFSAAAAKRASKYSASALLSRQPVARPLLCKLPEDNQGSNFFSSHCSNSGASSAASSSGGLDLLGSIMMDQNLLHLESKDVKINRDGSLTAKKAITASAVKEPKKKKQTSTLFFDSKEDENSSGHSDDDERNFGSSKVAASAGRRLGGRNNNNNDDNDDNATASQVDCEEKESSEQIESETEMKCSDTEPRDSDSETKPSTFESANEMSVPVNDDDEDDDDEEEEEAQEEEEETQDEEKEEKNESENVEDSFESNEADKAVENENVEENEDSCSRDSPAEVGLHSQTSELNDENVSPQKEDADQSYNSEAEDENENEEEEEDKEEEEEEEEENVEEEEENAEEEEDDEKVTYKDEQKDDNLSEHVEEEEEEEKAVSEEEKAASEVGSSGFSPAPSGSPGEKSRDAEQNSDAEEAKEEEEFLSDEETARKDAVEKMDESAEVSESVQDEQQAVSDADDTEDEDVTGKEDDEDSAKSDAEEIKDADESGPKSDAEDKDAELEVKSDAEDKDAELEVKSDAEDKDAELEVKSDAEDKDAELEVKSDVEDKDAELEVKSDAEDKDAELEVKSDAEDLDTQEPAEEMSILVKSDAEEENVLKETEEEEEETEVSEDVNKFATEEEEEENSPDLGTMQDDTLPSESEKTEEQEFPKPEDEDDDNCEALATENQPDQNEEEEEKEGKLEVADEASENFDDAASKNSEEMVKTHHEESETFEEQNEVGDEEVTAASGSESGMSSAGNEEEEEEEEEEEDEEEEKPKVPISELPRIPKRNRREGYRREKSSKGDGPELKSVLGRVDMPEYKMGRSWDKKDSRRSRWDPDDWSQSERDVDCASNRDRKSEGGKSYHSDRSESSRDSEKYPFEYKESKSRKRRRERSRSRSRGRKESAVEYRDIPHRRHSPERSKSRRRDRSRNRSRSGSREKSFDYDKSHKRKSRGRSRDRSQSRKSRRHRSYSRSPSRKRDKERGSADKRRHRDERKRGGEERGHKRHSDKSDPEESRKKRQSHEEYEDWDDGSCQVVDFDESTSPKGTTGKKAADCFYESHSSNEKLNENFFNRRTPQEKGAFKGDKMEDSGAFYNARGSSKKHKFVDRFYKAPHMRTVGTEKFPIHLSEDEGDEMGVSSKSHRSEHDDGGQDSGDSEYDPAFPTESGSPLREEAAEEAAKQSEEPVAPPVVVTATAPTVTTAAAVVSAAATEEIASSGPIDETPPSGSQSILGDSGYMIAENPNLQNIPIQPQNITFPMGIRMMPPGMQPGMPQHLLMNPMFLNRPPPFSRLPRISGPVGRLGWSMNPSGIMQIPPNRFGPTRMGPGGGMPPRPGLLNGGFEGMPQEPGQPMPPFKQHPCDPRNIPSHTAGHQGPPGQIPRPGLAGHPPPHMSHIHPPGPLLPHPQQHPPPPPPSSQQMHIPPPTSDTLSSSSLDSQNAPLHMQHGLGKSQPSSDDKSVPSNFCVPELNQITKLLEAHTQALQNKQRNTSSSLQGGDIDVFKIPLPPMAPPSIPPPTLGLPLVPPPDTHNYTSTTKSYKNGQSRLLANSHLTSEIASESTEVVDMDVASPLDDEVAIELPASPELDDIDESKINMKDSSVIELSVPEDMPASAVELTNLTNKEKHTSRVKKSNPKASQQRTVSPTSTKTSYMGYMKKLQIQERVVDEVKLAIKPFYSGKKIDKNEYKEILRKAVPKICHSKSGNINPAKIKALIEAYVDKMCKTRRYMERKKKGSLKANGERIKKPSR